MQFYLVESSELSELEYLQLSAQSYNNPHIHKIRLSLDTCDRTQFCIYQSDINVLHDCAIFDSSHVWDIDQTLQIYKVQEYTSNLLFFYPSSSDRKNKIYDYVATAFPCI